MGNVITQFDNVSDWIATRHVDKKIQVLCCLHVLTIVICWVCHIISWAAHKKEDNPYGDIGESGDAVGNLLYFTVMTQSTVGFGDISPKTHWAKALTAMHITIVLFLGIAAVEMITSYTSNRPYAQLSDPVSTPSTRTGGSGQSPLNSGPQTAVGSRRGSMRDAPSPSVVGARK